MATMKNIFHWAYRLAVDGRAQDLVESSLAAGFVAVAASAFFPPSIAPMISTIFSKVVEVLPDVGGG